MQYSQLKNNISQCTAGWETPPRKSFNFDIAITKGSTTLQFLKGFILMCVTYQQKPWVENITDFYGRWSPGPSEQ